MEYKPLKMEYRPFRTDIPIRITFNEDFNPGQKSCKVYVVCFGSFNRGHVVERLVQGTLENYQWDGTFRAYDQTVTNADYGVLIVFNEGTEGMVSRFISDVFHLDFSYQGSFAEEDLRVELSFNEE